MASFFSPLSVAISSRPHDTFSFHALIHGLVPGQPLVSVSYDRDEVRQKRAQEAAPQIVTVSAGALPWLLDDYSLIGSGSVLVPGGGPLVVSRDGSMPTAPTVAVSGLTTTGHQLLRLWAAERGLDVSVRVLPPDEVGNAIRNGVVDAAVVDQEEAGLGSCAALGDWWVSTTGLPVPLGAVLVRRDGDALTADVSIRASVELGLSDPAATRDFVLEHAPDLSDEECRRQLGRYVNDFTVELGDEGYAALGALLGRAAAAGLAPQVTADQLAPAG
ncbi:MAG TPA: MqnA/MqnD/SBP family protein [Mycobacteriales bacterium]